MSLLFETFAPKLVNFMLDGKLGWEWNLDIIITNREPEEVALSYGKEKKYGKTCPTERVQVLGDACGTVLVVRTV